MVNVMKWKSITGLKVGRYGAVWHTA